MSEGGGGGGESMKVRIADKITDMETSTSLKILPALKFLQPQHVCCD